MAYHNNYTKKMRMFKDIQKKSVPNSRTAMENTKITTE
jgi:hypothetical protein